MLQPLPRADIVAAGDVTRPAQRAVSSPGWQARLCLDLGPRAGRTRILRREHHGPLVVQRPFYPEGDVCHVLLLHPPGGMVGHDGLHTECRVAAGGAALLTTPGAGKLYRSAGREVNQRQHLRVAVGGSLEWLPQALIVYSGAHGRLSTRIELERGARFLGWDLICLGRPACAERFASGRLHQDLAILREGRCLYREAWRLDGDDAALGADWGLGGQPLLGTLLAAPAGRAELDAVRECLGAATPRAAATLLDDLLVVRVLAGGVEPAQALLEQAWNALRPGVIQRPPHRPRIWNT